MARIALALFVLLPFAASAQCYGTGSYRTCYDAQTGNSYNIQRFGNQTYMNGYNPSTGSTWNQNSTRIGNTIYQNGRAADGGMWNQTIQVMPGTTTYQGINSNGQPFGRTCNAFGCF